MATVRTTEDKILWKIIVVCGQRKIGSKMELRMLLDVVKFISEVKNDKR